MSGRVVKTSIASSPDLKVTRAPCERPIQFRCMDLTFSGQSSRSRSSTRRSAYAVIRIIHCRRLRRKTGKLPRSLRPSAVTSSFDSTVPRPGHQLTGASEMYTSRWSSITFFRSDALSDAQSRPSGVGREPSANAASSSAIGRALPASVSYHELKIRRKIHCVQR